MYKCNFLKIKQNKNILKVGAVNTIAGTDGGQLKQS